MPGTTATQGLTYPVQTDRTRDQALYLKMLAFQLEGKFNSHDYDITRSANPPFALLRVDTVQTLNTATGAPVDGDQIVYNQVMQDTGDLVDLSKNPRNIVLKQPGTWMVGAYCFTSGSGGTGAKMQLAVKVDGSDVTRQAATDGGGSTIWNNVEGPVVRINGTGIVTSHVSFTGTGVTNSPVVNRALMWAYWLRD